MLQSAYLIMRNFRESLLAEKLELGTLGFTATLVTVATRSDCRCQEKLSLVSLEKC
eukprot:XP_001708114.1 Hypothetical protein GL50803_37109 [Giardia lamblia ATCC 50803]